MNHLASQQNSKRQVSPRIFYLFRHVHHVFKADKSIESQEGTGKNPRPDTQFQAGGEFIEAGG